VALTVVIAYDISEDRRRSRVAATLQTFGDRIQRSVFILSIEPAALEELRASVHEMINLDVDSIYVFRQCAACWETIGIHGQATVEKEPLYWAVL